MAYAALETANPIGFGPAGLHGYGVSPTSAQTGWRPDGRMNPGLGDFTSELNTLVGDAEGAFTNFEDTTQTGVPTDANGNPIYPPGYSAALPPPSAVTATPAAAGSISFGGNTGMIVLALGAVALLAIMGGGGKSRR